MAETHSLQASKLFSVAGQVAVVTGGGRRSLYELYLERRRLRTDQAPGLASWLLKHWLPMVVPVLVLLAVNFLTFATGAKVYITSRRMLSSRLSRNKHPDEAIGTEALESAQDSHDPEHEGSGQIIASALPRALCGDP